jgi:hypothetical protein
VGAGGEVMVEYIEREALLAKLKQQYGEDLGWQCTIREFMGDYALDIEPFDGHKITLYFNSRRNAETVKRCIEVDYSKPNAATPVDFVEVVRCKDCSQWKRNSGFSDSPNGHCFYHCIDANGNDFCSYGERSYVKWN